MSKGTEMKKKVVCVDRVDRQTSRESRLLTAALVPASALSSLERVAVEHSGPYACLDSRPSTPCRGPLT